MSRTVYHSKYILLYFKYLFKSLLYILTCLCILYTDGNVFSPILTYICFKCEGGTLTFLFRSG